MEELVANLSPFTLMITITNINTLLPRLPSILQTPPPSSPLLSSPLTAEWRRESCWESHSHTLYNQLCAAVMVLKLWHWLTGGCSSKSSSSTSTWKINHFSHLLEDTLSDTVAAQSFKCPVNVSLLRHQAIFVTSWIRWRSGGDWTGVSATQLPKSVHLHLMHWTVRTGGGGSLSLRPKTSSAPLCLYIYSPTWQITKNIKVSYMKTAIYYISQMFGLMCSTPNTTRYLSIISCIFKRYKLTLNQLVNTVLTDLLLNILSYIHWTPPLACVCLFVRSVSQLFSFLCCLCTPSLFFA